MDKLEKILFNWLIYTIAVMVTAYLLSGVTVSNLAAALIVALVLGFINTVIKPILLVLTLPITFLTLGIFALVVNALMVMLASEIVPGFYVDGFWWALAFSCVLSLVNWSIVRFGRNYS